MDSASVIVTAASLEQLVADIFEAAGCSRAEAGRIGRYLVAANLAGHDSHGVVRVPRYVQMLRDGLLVADQKVEVLVDTPVLAVIDGKFGFGQTVAPQAVEFGIEKCRQMGLAAVALRNSGHIGRVGDWAEMAARAGLVSIHFVNATGSVIVAPFGSTERRFSTAPYCVGVPLPGRAPLVLDFATSVVAEGKVLVASQGGRPIPADSLVGPDGRSSDDPRLLYGNYAASDRRDPRKGAGALRAFGGHKGSGLALMCEILGGALTGNGCTSPERRIANGMFSLYVDPGRIDPQGVFPDEVVRYVDYVKQAKPARPGEETLVPGEPEHRMRAQRLAQGVPLSREIWTSIVEAAHGVGIDAGSGELTVAGGG
ncbi:MAG TPA: malate/lactate/ureidoglycolate dehydrogenase [Burkholderiales bacterium]|nr:malate/lactate/ureidoglycolate dehydrogenase [Burkholderiales bacterium]